MNRLLLAASAALATMFLTTASAQACGVLDFGCNAAKKTAEKTQMVISIIDAGRNSGWKNVRKEFSNREIAEMRRLGLDPTNRGLINALKGVNDEHFEDLSDDLVMTIRMAAAMPKNPLHLEAQKREADIPASPIGLRSRTDCMAG